MPVLVLLLQGGCSRPTLQTSQHTHTKLEEKLTPVSSSLTLGEQHYWDQNKVTSSKTFFLKSHIFSFLTVAFEMTCVMDGEHTPSAAARTREVLFLFYCSLPRAGIISIYETTVQLFAHDKCHHSRGELN